MRMFRLLCARLAELTNVQMPTVVTGARTSEPTGSFFIR